MKASVSKLAGSNVRRTGASVGFLWALMFVGCGGKDRYAPENVQLEDPGPGERYVDSLFAMGPNGRQDALTEIASIRSKLRLNAASKECGKEFDRATSDRERALATIAFAEQLPKSDDDDPDRVAAALRDRAFRLGPLESHIDSGALERDSFYSATRLAEYEWSENHPARAIEILRSAHAAIEPIRDSRSYPRFDLPSDRLDIESLMASILESVGETEEALVWLDRAMESERRTISGCALGREAFEDQSSESRARLLRKIAASK